MNSTTLTTDILPSSVVNYYVIIPLSLICILVAIIIACIILSLVIFIKRLHTVTHLLICNGSIASIFYCIVQSINYIYLAFIPGEINDFSCRLRGFFSYMSISAIMHSYLAQAISRYFISVLSNKYQWATSFKTHIILIFIQWSIATIIPLPALLTEDIYHRPHTLCWVPKEYTLHVTYTIIAYYLIPTVFIFVIYIGIYLRVKRHRNSVFITIRGRRSNRDLELLYNIMILFALYIFGALPIILFILTKIDLFYTIGIISVSLALAIEKGVTLVVDRDIRNIIKKCLRQSIAKVRPPTRNFA